MEVIANQIEQVTRVVRTLLEYLNIQPESYRFLFPAGKDSETIRQLVTDGVFPVISSLAPAFTYAIVLGIIRFLLNHAILKQFARVSMKIVTIPQQRNSDIEEEFPMKNKTTDGSKVKAFCSRPGIKLTPSAVNEYLWARRRNAASSKKIVKFVESFWRFLLHTGSCFIGYKTLFVPVTASWILDTNQHWDNWPIHSITQAMEFYYQIQLGCYIHQVCWTEVSRSDAMEMIIHHVTTILLLTFSYITNFTRVGASILLLHDSSDVFLESAKCFNYVSKAKDSKWACKFCDTIFALFAITFFVTRLIIYPRYIIYSVFFEAPTHFGTNWAGFWVFSVLLVILQLLHIFWFYLIAKMLWTLLSTGVEKDERSDDDEVDEEFKEETETTSKSKENNTVKLKALNGGQNNVQKKSKNN